jgi:hypothetical protein
MNYKTYLSTILYLIVLSACSSTRNVEEIPPIGCIPIPTQAAIEYRRFLPKGESEARRLYANFYETSHPNLKKADPEYLDLVQAWGNKTYISLNALKGFRNTQKEMIVKYKKKKLGINHKDYNFVFNQCDIKKHE